MAVVDPQPRPAGHQSWEGQLLAALVALVGDAAAPAIANRWHDRFTSPYRDSISAADAAADLIELEALTGPGHLRIRFSGHPDQTGRVSLSVYSGKQDLELSRFLPILESLGLWVFDELHWSLGDDRWHVYDFRVRRADRGPVEVEADGSRICDAAIALWQGRADVDGLNRLVTFAAMSWSDVDLLRAYRRFRRQVDPRYGETSITDVLVEHPVMSRGLVDLFKARLDPESSDPDVAAQLAASLGQGCDRVIRLDHDRILRGMVGSVMATVRTNRWLRPGGPLALKFDSRAVPDVPAPAPYREIFVHGRTVQGVHLRAGRVARGGLRWSDRAEDLRTEVLDLMRTQVLKNSLIVPTGAKGGFVLTGPAVSEPAGPVETIEPFEHETRVRAAYECFVEALLDVTDDRRGGAVVPVPGRLDGDDPYLVVAADRGTATLSDLANDLAERRGFWLGDAFASGGSHGYDHKALGVTARGAWEAVRHHFTELGVDVQREPFTVVGIGDMSGDVFGNGMLQSDQLRLVAAFDHRDIFIDPNPDPAATFSERQRLFHQPGSAWRDFDRSLISTGGGIWPRTAKHVDLTPEVQAALRVPDASLTPAELIRAVLRAPVDLLFAGGVGTFVRAGHEDDRRIDDRANAELRVEASSLRARVVAEGANLAFTQPARIEYARRGGRINMDAIDNSAGVDTSDQEVNLKILLGLAMEAGELDPADRDAVFAAGTDDVVESVLAHTVRQCERLTIAHQSSVDHPTWFDDVLTSLVEAEVIDPAVEVLPDRPELDARRRAGAGLTRPELAVLMAGTKRWLTGELLASDVPEQPAARAGLVASFPPAISQRFDHLLDRHPLRRELIASRATNDIVDRMGITFVPRLCRDTGASAPEVVAAAGVARGVTGANASWAAFGDADRGPVFESAVAEPRRVLVELLEALTRWELAHRHGDGIDVVSRIADDRPVYVELLGAMPSLGTKDQRARRTERAEGFVDRGLDPPTAVHAALLPELHVVPDIALLCREIGRPATDVAQAFFAVDDLLGLDRLEARLGALTADDRWAQAAQRGLLEDVEGIRRLAARQALSVSGGPLDAAGAVASYLERESTMVAEAGRLRREVESDPDAGLDALTVAVRAVRRAVS